MIVVREEAATFVHPDVVRALGLPREIELAGVRFYRAPRERYPAYRGSITIGDWFGVWWSRPFSFGMWVGPYRMTCYGLGVVGRYGHLTDPPLPGVYFDGPDGVRGPV